MMTKKELMEMSLLQLRQLNNQLLNDADKFEKKALEYRQEARKIRDIHDERERVAQARAINRIGEMAAGVIQ